MIVFLTVIKLSLFRVFWAFLEKFYLLLFTKNCRNFIHKVVKMCLYFIKLLIRFKK